MSKDFGDLLTLNPLNEAQRDWFDSLRDDSISVAFGIGPSGVGKTCIALYEGVRMLKKRKIRCIYYAKPIVDSLGLKSVGFLPGDIDEKLAPLLFPVRDNLSVFCKDGLAKYLIDRKQIEPILIQDLRGRSLSNCLLICDEVQNCSIAALKLILTRIGDNSKFVLLGDPDQRDVTAKIAGPEPLQFANTNLQNIEGVSFNYFTSDDIVRNGIIAKILKRFDSKGV